MFEVYKEWNRIRRWVRKNYRLRTYRFMTSVENHGWVALEMYPDGDCALLGGPGHGADDLSYCPPMIVHGMRFWMLDCQERMVEFVMECSTERLNGFAIPKFLDRKSGSRLKTNCPCPWALSMVADKWWRIRELILSNINLNDIRVQVNRKIPLDLNDRCERQVISDLD